MLTLLANGTPPQAIRIVDVRGPTREEFTEENGQASRVVFVPGDITTESGTLDSFEQPWPEDVGHLPLTIFHTVGLIRPQERSHLFWDRIARVNVTGTAHIVAAARRVGAGILIFTSSGTVEHREVDFFPPPWRQYPRNFVQYLNGSDWGKPLRPDPQFQNNYGRSKARGERLVCDADADGGMRTAAIRPCLAVYGRRDDFVLGKMLSLKTAPTLNAMFVQNWTCVINVALAHVQLEAALLLKSRETVNKVAGKVFLVTDDGPALRFMDVWKVLSANSVNGFRVICPPPLLFLCIMHIVELWAVLSARYPAVIRRVLGEPRDPIDILQPGTAAATITSIADDSGSKKAPEEGGFGYRPACTSVEGMCALVAEWNEHTIKEEKERESI